MTWRKIKSHLKYRATRAKTYLGLMIAALGAAMPYLAGTDWLDPASKAMAACAFMLALVGSNNADASGK